MPGLAFEKALGEARGPGVALERLAVRADGSLRIADLPEGEWSVALMETLMERSEI